MQADTLEVAPKRKKKLTPAQRELIARLKALRERKKFDNQQLADFIGISLHTLKSWLYGVNQPSPLARRFLDKLFGNK